MALLRSPVHMVADDGLVATLQAAEGRRFANVTRITLTVDVTNRGRYERSLGDIQLRLSVDGPSMPPFDRTMATAQPAADVSGSWVFDIPPRARRAVLDVTLGDHTSQLPLHLP